MDNWIKSRLKKFSEKKCDHTIALEALKYITELEEENKRFEDALQKIVDPIQALSDEAEAEDCKLDGLMAVQIEKDAETLKSWAKDALRGVGRFPMYVRVGK